MSHPVYLNVYDNSSSAITRYLRFLGLGLYLSSVQVHGMEHIFWPDHDGGEDGFGIVSGDLHQIECLQGRTLLHSIRIGDTQLDSDQVLERKHALQNTYTAASYHPFTNNCHHFSDNFCRDLTNIPIPRWLNRIATIGWCCCSCLTAKDEETAEPQEDPDPPPQASGSSGSDNGDGGNHGGPDHGGHHAGGDDGGHGHHHHGGGHFSVTLMDHGLLDFSSLFHGHHHILRYRY